MTEYEIGKHDGKNAAAKLWTSSSNRERTILLNQYNHHRQSSLLDLHKDYERGFVEGFLRETTRRGDC